MDATQKQTNKMLGISDEVFAKYNPPEAGRVAKATAKLDREMAGLTETQIMINKALGISEETWRKHNPHEYFDQILGRMVVVVSKLSFQGHKEV